MRFLLYIFHGELPIDSLKIEKHVLVHYVIFAFTINSQNRFCRQFEGLRISLHSHIDLFQAITISRLPIQFFFNSSKWHEPFINIIKANTYSSKPIDYVSSYNVFNRNIETYYRAFE